MTSICYLELLELSIGVYPAKPGLGIARGGRGMRKARLQLISSSFTGQFIHEQQFCFAHLKRISFTCPARST